MGDVFDGVLCCRPEELRYRFRKSLHSKNEAADANDPIPFYAPPAALTTPTHPR